MNKKFILLGVVLIAVIISSYYLEAITGFFAGHETVFVKRVIDGDTIELSSGETVRLLGINTPERGQYLFRESTDWLKETIEGKKIFLEADVENMDKYDRLLRHVFLSDRFIDLELVEKGYAEVLIIPPNEKYSDRLLEAETRAKEEELGIWLITIPDAFCLGIFYFHYNAKGNDNENLNDEFITFRNSCEYPIDISDWVLRDKSDMTYIFPDLVLAEKTKLNLHTGSGEDNITDLYWDSSRAIWNNNGDGLLVWNKEGDLILNYSY